MPRQYKIDRNLEMIDLRKSGMTYKAIGEKFGISEERAIFIVRYYDPDLVEKEQKERVERNRTIRWAIRTKTFSRDQIAKAYGLSKSTICDIWKGRSGNA